MAFLNACSGVLTIFLIGSVGYLLARRNAIPANISAVWPKFVTTVALPPYLLRHITATFERDELVPLLSGLVIPFLSMFLTFALACALVRVLRVAPGRRGIFRTSFATSSALNIGLPINVTLFGDAAVPYVLLYMLANATVFWTIGNYSIAHDGEDARVKLFSLQTLKHVCSPPLVGFVLGLALVFLDVHLPEFLDKTCKYVGDLAIALSVMFIGVMLRGIRLSEVRLGKDMIAIFTGRFLITPLCVLGLTFVYPVPELMRNVFIIQGALPVMMNVAILASYYKADARYAAVVTSVSTLIAMVTIPLYMVLISHFLS